MVKTTQTRDYTSQELGRIYHIECSLKELQDFLVKFTNDRVDGGQVPIKELVAILHHKCALVMRLHFKCETLGCVHLTKAYYYLYRQMTVICDHLITLYQA